MADLQQGAVIEPLGLGFLGSVRTAPNASSVVGAGHAVLLAHLFGPPANCGHAVLDSADGEALCLPSCQQQLDVLGLEAGCA